MQQEFSEQLLAIAVERRGALAALAREPHHREELEAELDVSKTTCHRIIRTFDDRGLLGRTDSGYVLTPLGELLSDLVGEFESSARLAYRLEPLVTQLNEAGIEFGMALYDSHLDLRVYDEEIGTPVLYVDTDDPAAIEWGESLYERYQERADPASSLDEYPDWAPETPLEPPASTH
jgi:predicted transcriptional regulator